MSILFWNSRGAGSLEFLRHAKELIRVHIVDILIIAEPRISGVTADKMIGRLRFDAFTKVDAQGFSGVYASPTPSTRELLWNYLFEFQSFDSMPWLLIDDFNQILSGLEKQGGRPKPTARMKPFMEIMTKRNLIDLEAKGCKYTWSNNQHVAALIKKRLDRAICNVAWRQFYSDVWVQNLPKVHSDHCPVLVSMHGSVPHNSAMKPFRFEMAWLAHDTFKELLQMNWLSEDPLHDSLLSFQEVVSKWNKEVFGNIFKKKRRLLARIQGVQKALEVHANSFLYRLEQRLVSDYNEVLFQEELLWFQKSRSNWVQFGDRNTSFFHTTTIVRRHRNRIITLKKGDGSWCSDRKKLKEMVLSFFQHMYMAEPLYTDIDMVCPRSQSSLEEAQLLSLLHIPQNEEIFTTLQSMAPFKAPGPDGFQAGFYQKNWDVVGNSICNFIKNAFITGSFDESLSKVLVVLIPKIEHPEMVSHFKHIILCNVSVKLISKIIVNHIRPLMINLIAPNQCSFIPGRGTTDNIVVVQEAIHTFSKKKRESWKHDLEN
ncbi:hypothetical protein REPUB_Repub14bG0086100 [Reevesia pubescens]